MKSRHLSGIEITAGVIGAIALISLLLGGCVPGAPDAAPTRTPGQTPLGAQASLEAETPMKAGLEPIPAPTLEVHTATGAGQWYPADPAQLADMVDGFLEQVQREGVPAAEPVALIVPHAGFIYSGQVAAYAYKVIEGMTCDTVVVMGDTHTGRGLSSIAVYARGAFQTPLGTIAIDEEVAEALMASSERIQFERESFVGEHPVENQLPFLQRACEDLRIVPLVINEPTLENARLLSEALVGALEGKAPLIVASTDLSHYHPYEEARRIDEIALRAIVSLDPERVLKSPQECARAGISNVKLTMCSRGAVMTAILAAKVLGANRATVLRYATSGDTPFGDRQGVVGYGAVMLWRGEERGNAFTLPDQPSAPEGRPLGTEEQGVLLDLARETLSQFLSRGIAPEFVPTSPDLLQEEGAFVTLEKGGELRGCVGRLVVDEPLYLTVQRVALAAALEDQRFPPLQAQELPEVDIEISVLSPPRQIAHPEEIEIGRHGVVLRAREKQAVFLPQVAPEQGWDRQELLRQLCIKAGLPGDAWEEGSLYVFTAQVFQEEALS